MRNPVVPSEKIAGDSTSSHQLLGLWQFVADPDAGTLDVIHLRDADLHLNALKFLEPPVNLYLTLEGPPQFNGNILDVDIGLTHPFAGQHEYTGFDVSGIFISHGTVSGFTDADIVLPGEGDTRLLNADGYSRWWNPVDYPAGNTIFNYIDGLLGTPHEVAQFNCTVNGYKYFCDNLGLNDELGELDPGTESGMFSAGQKNVRHYTIDLGDEFVFNYAVDANWKKPTSGPPYFPPDCFPPGAWRPEAWNVSIQELENTLWYSGSVSGGDLSLLIDVWDHFDAGSNTVIVESLGNFNLFSSDTPVGGGPGYSTYQVDIIDATPSSGIVDALITVEAVVPGGNLCAYFTHRAFADVGYSECEGPDETESNGSCATANQVEIDVAVLGCVQEVTDTWDYWEFEVTADGNYDIFLFNDGAGDIDLAYYDSDCTWLGSSGLHGAGEDEEIEGIDFENGTYFASVKADDDSGPYSEERHYHLLVEYNPPVNYSLAIAYYDVGNGNLKFAWIDQVGDWQTETVDDTTAEVGNRPQLAFNSSGHPLIYYADKTSGVLKSAYNDGSGWDLDSHFAILWVYGFEFDSEDNPHIVYFGPGWSPLKYGYYDGSVWDTVVVDASPGGTGAAVALDSGGYPHITNDDMGGNLRYSYKDAGGWHSEVVYNSGAMDSSIAFDSDGYPHVLHSQNYSPLRLYHTYYNGTIWDTDEVTAPGYQPKIQIDSEDIVHFTCTNGSAAYPQNHIIYAYQDGVSWSFEVVDDTSYMMYSSFVLASNGDKHVSYYDKTQGDLRYAYHDGVEWHYEIVDSEGDVGTSSRIALYQD